MKAAVDIPASSDMQIETEHRLEASERVSPTTFVQKGGCRADMLRRGVIDHAQRSSLCTTFDE
jgi:hypothetical protein